MMMGFFSAMAETAERAVSVADQANATAATSTAAAGTGDMISMLLMMAVMIAVFYFMLIRPQRKKEKAVKNMLDNLKKGDRIWTIGGFYGTIVGMKDDQVDLRLGSNSQFIVVTIKRSAVGGVDYNKNVENDSLPEI